MLRHDLRLIYIKSYNDQKFVKIYHNLPKFGNLGKIGNLKGAVSRNAAKLGNHKMPVKLRET